MKQIQSEHDIQSMIFLWSKYQSKKYPGISYMFAIPNGGFRHIATAKNLKMEGVKPGVPDIFLPVPRAGYGGLFLEVKAKGGRASDYQKIWLEILTAQGYRCRLVRGFDEAIAAIEEYYSLVNP
jgi:hypothetical protein